MASTDMAMGKVRKSGGSFKGTCLKTYDYFNFILPLLMKFNGIGRLNGIVLV